jgi:hypothetical protein
MKSKNLTLKVAYEEYMRCAGDDHVKINDGFLQQLMSWDKLLYGESRFMIKSILY